MKYQDGLSVFKPLCRAHGTASVPTSRVSRHRFTSLLALSLFALFVAGAAAAGSATVTALKNHDVELPPHIQSSLDGWDLVWRWSIRHQLQQVQEKRAQLQHANTGQLPRLRLIFHGDSTMHAQYNFMCIVLDDACDEPHAPSQRKCALRSSIDVVDACHSRALNVHAQLVGDGMCSGWDSLSRLQAEPPEDVVFYFGCGLHLLYFGKARPWWRFSSTLNVEQNINRTLHTVEQKYGADTQLVWMSTHTIVDEKFRGDYAEVRQRWSNSATRAKVVEDCVKDSRAEAQALAQAGALNSGRGTWEAQVQEMCDHAIFLDEGVQYMNRRQLRYLAARGPLDVVDAHTITWQKAWATKVEDGRHYTALAPAEVDSLVAHIVSRWLPAPQEELSMARLTRPHHPSD